MSQIGVLITGAGIQTTIAGQSQLDSYILLGDVDTPMPLSGISVEVDGKSQINIANSQPLVSAFSKFMMQFTATVVGLLIKVATGKQNKNTTYRLTNNGATTPAIFAFSDASEGFPIQASTVGINASSYQDFREFTALMITPSANVNNIEIFYKDGQKATMSIAEVDALFNMKNQCDANGRLDAVVSSIDNREGRIESVRVNATTAVTVLIMKLPQEEWDRLKAQGKI